MIWGHPFLTCQPPYKHLLSSIWWSEDIPYYWPVSYRTNICRHPSDDLRTSLTTDLSATVHTSVVIHLMIWWHPLLTCQLPYKHLLPSIWWSEDIPYYWPVSYRTNICCHPSDDLRTSLTTDLSATVQTSVTIHRTIWGHPLLLTCQPPYKHLLPSIGRSEDIPYYWPVSHRTNICYHPSDDLRTSLTTDLSATVHTSVVIHLTIWGHPLLLTCQPPYKHLLPSIWWSEDIPYYWPVSYRTHICCHPSDDLRTSLTTDLSATVHTSVVIHLPIWGHPLLLTCQLLYIHLLPSIWWSEDIPYYWPVSYRTNICRHPSDDLRTSLTTDLSATVQTSVVIHLMIWGHPLLLTCQLPYKHLLSSIWWSEEIPYYWPVSYRTNICRHPSDDLRTSLTTDLSATVQTSVAIHLMIWGHPLLLTCQLPYKHLLSSIWWSEDIPYYWPVSYRTNICCHPSDDLRTSLTTDLSATVQTSVVIHLMIWGHPLLLTCQLPYKHLLSSIWRSEDLPYYWPVSYRTNICFHPSDDLRTSLTTDLSVTVQTSVAIHRMIWGHPLLLTCQLPYKHLLSSIWWSEDIPYWPVSHRINICCHPSDDLRTSLSDLSATVQTSVVILLMIWGHPFLTCQLPYKHLSPSIWWSEDIPYYWPVSYPTHICCHPSDDLMTSLTDLSATVQTSVAIHLMIWGHPLLLTCQLPYKHLLPSIGRSEDIPYYWPVSYRTNICCHPSDDLRTSLTTDLSATLQTSVVPSIWWSEDIPYYWPVSYRTNICCHPSDDLRTSLTTDLSATVQTSVVIHLTIWGHPLLLTCQLPYKHLLSSIWRSEDIPYYWPVSYRTNICCHPSDDLRTSLTTDLSATVQTSVVIHLMIWGHPLLLTCQLPYKHLLSSIGRSEDIPYYWPVSYRTNICCHPSDDLRTSLTTDLSATVQTSVVIHLTIWGHPLLLTCQLPYKHLLSSIWRSEDIPYYWPVSYRTNICCHPSDDLMTSLTTDLSATVQTSVAIHLTIWGHPLLLTCQLPYKHLLSSIGRSEDIPYYWPVSYRTNICCHPSDDLRTSLTTDLSATVQTSVVIHLTIWGHPLLLTCQLPYKHLLSSIWWSEDIPYYWPVSYRTNICRHPSDDLRTSLTTDLSATVQTYVAIHLMIWGHPLLLTCQLPYKHLLSSIWRSEDIPYYWPVSYRTNICCHPSDDLRTFLTTDLSATVQTSVVIHLMIWGHPLLLTCQLPYKHLLSSIWWSEDIPYYWPVSYRTNICCHPSDDLRTSFTTFILLQNFRVVKTVFKRKDLLLR